MFRRILASALLALVASGAHAQSPVEVARDRAAAAIERECADLARKAGIPRNVAARRAGWSTRYLFDDGPAAYVVDGGKTRCADVGQLICGTGGCPHAVIIGRPGGRTMTIRQNALSFSSDNGETIDLDVHGGNCGRPGNTRCKRVIDVRSGKSRTLLADRR